MSIAIGEKAPNFGVSEWVQGAPTNFDQEKDHSITRSLSSKLSRMFHECNSRSN